MTIKFNNKKQVGLRGMILALMVLIALGLVAGNYLIIEPRNITLELILWGVLLVAIAVYYFGGFYYVDVELTAEKIDIKFYRLFPFGRQYKRILIPVEKVKKIKLSKGLGGLGRSLKIEGSIQGRHAIFPSVGIAACDKTQINELKKYIDFINKEN
nr:hypothetical protein [uncultured Carboxylicivirga sp.]